MPGSLERSVLLPTAINRWSKDVTLKLLSEEETGAEHCQHDNPTIGQEYMADWLVDVFAIDERALRRRTLRPMG